MLFNLFKRRSVSPKHDDREQKERKDISLLQLNQQNHSLTEQEDWFSKKEEEGWSKLPWNHPERAQGRARYLDQYFDPPRRANQRDVGPGLLRRVHIVHQSLRKFRPDPINHTDRLDELLDVLEECEIALGSIEHRNRWLGQRAFELEYSLQLCTQQKASLTRRVTDLAAELDLANEKCRGLEAHRIQEYVADLVRLEADSYAGAMTGESSRPPSYHADNDASRPPLYHTIHWQGGEDDDDVERWETQSILMFRTESGDDW
ncbi:hypothetical protein E2P81_ATG09284 [Venturia nashicola]|uniref:Uncharacterized protein n=1 Tax=Venturia nashicola TaxID=86259 RepID=A0A4Z1NGF6_9PEZI|nr:hypothetical protein E6O75_ATG09490 [Venturia nashicola]TLD20214.1 hypothetical protein E2P81_ATG09284 [Venturia nashicola]